MNLTIDEKHELLLGKLYNKHPTILQKIKILTTINSYNDTILVEDKYGICKFSYEYLMKGELPTINSAVDKLSYYENKLRYKNPTILSFIEEIVNYEEDTDFVLIRTKYGLVRLNKTNSLRSKKIDIKTAVNPTEYWINQAKEVHGDRYDYSLVKYKGNKTKVKIICEHHGIFEQRPMQHLKYNCQKCGREITKTKNINNNSGWTHSNWNNKGLKSKYFDSFKVYIIECYNENERFFKIGKTFLTTKNRFKAKKDVPYQYKIVKEIIGDGIFISKFEDKLKQENKKFKYVPKIKFKGMSECFSQVNTYFSRELLPILNN